MARSVQKLGQDCIRERLIMLISVNLLYLDTYEHLKL